MLMFSAVVCGCGKDDKFVCEHWCVFACIIQLYHYNIPVGCVSVAFVVTLTDTLLSSSFPDIPLSAITVIV